MCTQTDDGEGVKHALVQAGDGKLLSDAELQDQCNQRELRVRGLMHVDKSDRETNKTRQTESKQKRRREAGGGGGGR